jgi:putative ABC transport system ATP-binding protein
MLRSLNKETEQTIVMITHNPEAAAYADRTIHMRDGHVVSEERNNGRPASSVEPEEAMR